MKSSFRFSRISLRPAATLCSALLAAALAGCMDPSAPAGNEVAVAAAIGTPPVITQQPQDLSPRVGDRYAFGVTATSATPVTYRWQRCLYHSNCADVGNGPSFSRVAHGSDSSYFVRCIVSNAYGVVTTRWANAWPRWVNMQAEDGAYTGAAVTTEGTDWSGRGALIFWSNTGTLTVKPQINNAGTYKLWMRYKSPAPVSVKLELNGAVLKSNWALPSGTYNNFILLDVQLPVGVSTLKLTLLSGSPVIDGFDIL